MTRVELTHTVHCSVHQQGNKRGQQPDHRWLPTNTMESACHCKRQLLRGFWLHNHQHASVGREPSRVGEANRPENEEVRESNEIFSLPTPCPKLASELPALSPVALTWDPDL